LSYRHPDGKIAYFHTGGGNQGALLDAIRKHCPSFMMPTQSFDTLIM